MQKRFKLGHAIIALATTVILAGSASFLAGEDGDRESSSFQFALIGDVPYTPTSGTAPKVQTYPSPEYNAVIADINSRDSIRFTAHMGDTKAGDTWCAGGNATKDPVGAANVYTSNLTLMNSFQKGMIYLPGDNEWTDCHRTNNGAYDPTERLAYLRSIFFTSSTRSLGQEPIVLTRQSSTAGFELYKENVMWRIGGVIFVGLNQPGSNNNHQRNVANSSPVPTDNSEAEWAARDLANVAWVNKAFDTAAEDRTVKGITIMNQANVFERYLEPLQNYTRSGYERFVTTLRDRTVAFGKPVVLVGGDTHIARADKPMTTLYPGHTDATGTGIQLATAGTRVLNFTRVEVFGQADINWIRVIVDPSDPNLFSYSFQTIAGDSRGDDDQK